MGCRLELSLDNAVDCVEDAASAVVSFVRSEPTVVVAWAGAATACIAAPPSCPASVSMALGYTAERAQARAMDAASGYLMDRGGELLESTARRTLEASHEAIDALLDAEEITPYEASRLKDLAAEEMLAPTCPLDAWQKGRARWAVRRVVAGIYEQNYARMALPELADAAISDLAYQDPDLRAAVSNCPAFIEEIRPEIYRHLLRWGAAETPAEMPGRPPPIVVLKSAGATLSAQARVVRDVREARQDHSAKETISRLRRLGLLSPRSATDLHDHLVSIGWKDRRADNRKRGGAGGSLSLTGITAIFISCGLAILAAKR